jgi:hypothetical protein
MAKRTGRAGFLVLALLAAGCSGSIGDDKSSAAAPLADVCGEAAKPQLARPAAPRADSRARVTDTGSHLSYIDAGPPWQPWSQAISPGHLGALFNTGYYIVTDGSTPNGEYFASVLSGRVYPGQQAHPDLKCVAAQVSEDLRNGNAYPTPNQRSDVAEKAMSVNGYPAYLVRYNIEYHKKGYDATGETITVVIVDVRQSDLAIFYTSIPNNATEYNTLVDQIIASLQVT